MAGFPRQVREQWPAFLALLGVMLLYVQVADVRGAIKSTALRQQNMESRLNGAQAAAAEQHLHRRSARSVVDGGEAGFTDETMKPADADLPPPDLTPAEKIQQAEASSPDRSASKSQSPKGMPQQLQQQKKKPKGDSAKAEYEWPEVLEEWKLVSDSEANNAPLKGEGVLTQDIMSIERKGDGVLYNAVHREPSAQRASKPIVEAMEGAKRMRQASKEAGNDSKLRYALVTERAPYHFMLNETLCRSLWPECVGFKDAIKVSMLE